MIPLIPAVIIAAMIVCFTVLPANAGKNILVGISKIVANPALDILKQGARTRLKNNQ